MDIRVLSILKTIESYGYNAFLVGGYVRDMIHRCDNIDIDISTDAPVKLILDCFKEYNPKLFKYSSITFKLNELTIDITHFRKEKFNNKLVIDYSFKLKDDYNRRDFSMNAIYLDSNNVFFDYSNSIADCKNNLVAFIGNPKIRCIEDPIRILRLIYLILKYDFEYDVKNTNFELSENNFTNINISLLNKYVIRCLKTCKYDRFFNLLRKFNIYSILFTSDKVDYCYDVNEMLLKLGYKFSVS